MIKEKDGNKVMVGNMARELGINNSSTVTKLKIIDKVGKRSNNIIFNLIILSI